MDMPIPANAGDFKLLDLPPLNSIILDRQFGC